MSDQVGKEGAPASDPLRDWGLGFPPAREMIVEECDALGKRLVQYDFMAARLVPSLEETHRFEIDCNGAGIVVVVARTERKLSEFGVISAPNPKLRELVVFL
ncbi:hypothetical protein JHK87_050338 [Glycine soja]|nr:hypothetical protein JHK87_050338 [Glycine soja]